MLNKLTYPAKCALCSKASSAHLCPTHFDESLRYEASEAERRIVEWLRNEAPLPYMQEEGFHPFIIGLALRIERGDHRA